jgi:hypothetical protein
MSAELVPIHLGTGEILDDLPSAETEMLAEALELLRERRGELELMRKAVETELAHRLTVKALPRGRVWVQGDFGLRFKNRSEWDADELEGVLRHLLDEGELTSRDVLGLIEHVPKVKGANVDRLLKRLVGPAHAAIEQCRRWTPAGLAVERQQPLLPEAEGDDR